MSDTPITSLEDVKALEKDGLFVHHVCSGDIKQRRARRLDEAMRWLIERIEHLENVDGVDVEEVFPWWRRWAWCYPIVTLIVLALIRVFLW